MNLGQDSFFTDFLFLVISDPQSLYTIHWSSLMAQMIKTLHAMKETWVQSLGQEDPLKKGMATHSSILAWRSPRTEEPGGIQSVGSQRVRLD